MMSENSCRFWRGQLIAFLLYLLLILSYNVVSIAATKNKYSRRHHQLSDGKHGIENVGDSFKRYRTTKDRLYNVNNRFHSDKLRRAVKDSPHLHLFNGFQGLGLEQMLLEFEQEAIRSAKSAAMRSHAKYLSMPTPSIYQNYTWSSNLPQNYFQFNITLLFILYYDVDLILEILKLNKPFISEIVIVDGPRQAATSLLSAMGLLYEKTSIVRQFFESTVKRLYPQLTIRYTFNIWENEEKQREVGYHLATNDLLLIAEGDVLMKLDPISIYRFLHYEDYIQLNTTQYRRRGIGQLQIWNLVSSNMYFTSINDSNIASTPIYHPALVHRQWINSSEFFDHLWIVGRDTSKVSSRQPNPYLIYHYGSMGEEHHYTIARNPISMIIKYAFYLTMPSNYQQWFINRNIDLIGIYYNISKEHGVNIARDLFLHSTFEGGTCLTRGYLYSTTTQLDYLFPNETIAHQRFPELFLPTIAVGENGIGRLCDYTFLSGNQYYSFNEDPNYQRHIPITPGIESYIALNHQQSMQNKLCLKLSNIRTKCRATVYKLQLGREAEIVSESINSVNNNKRKQKRRKRRNNRQKDEDIVDSANNTENNLLILSLNNLDVSNNDAIFVRFVLSMNCYQPDDRSSNSSIVGWYEEAICPSNI